MPGAIPAQNRQDRTPSRAAMVVRVCGLVSAREEEALQNYLLIALGGALGSIARYGVGSWVAGRLGIRFPYGTLVVNITACLVIGFSMSFLGRHTDVSPAWRFFVPVG